MSDVKKKLFIPRKIDERLVEWNKQQPFIDDIQINQYDLKTGNPTGRWGEGELDGGDTVNLFATYWDVFVDGGMFDDEYPITKSKDWLFNFITKKVQENFADDISEYGPLGLMHFDLTLPLNSKEIENKFDELYNKEFPIKENKLFIPRKLSQNDSRWEQWNKEQPIVNGIQINQYDMDGKEQGYWEHYYDNGKYTTKGNYINGKKEGIWKSISDDGILIHNGLYKNDEIRQFLPLHESKKLFIPRKLSGEDNRYYQWNKEQPIKDGVRINQYNPETGERDGLWEIYDNGKIVERIGYNHGKKNGIYQTFHTNGKPQFHGQMKDDEFDGLWKQYYFNGKLRNIGEYRDGKSVGIWKWYYPFENQLETIVNYVNGRADGLAMEYFANGNIWKKMVYRLGKKIAYIIYTYDGDVNESMDWKDEYDNMVIKEQMEDKDSILKSFEPQKELNPKIWDDDGKLKKKIKDTLVAIGQEFHKTLEVEAPIDDIIFTGSLANYNWSQYSDVDLHVLMDFNEFDDKELIKKYFDAKKAVWNDNHDIKIKGYDVELYAQDKDEPHESTGIYSVMKDEWVRKPKPQDVKIDRETIKKKVKQFEGEYNRILELYKEEKYEETRKALDKIKDKIKKYRKAGLDKGGEMATENLVFKTMRRSGLMDKIYKLGLETTDKEYTIETIEESKKLFIPRKLSGEGSRWEQWNKIQPIKDGVQINQYDSEGRKTGYWEDYYSNGELWRKGEYVNDKMEGIWEFYYYGNGELRSKVIYKNGRLIEKLPLTESKKLFVPRRLSGEGSRWEQWNEEQPIIDGKRINQYDSDGKKEGYWEENWSNTDKLNSKGNYVDDVKDGMWVFYHSDGSIWYEEEFKNGDPTGYLILYYYNNKKLVSKKLFKNDIFVKELPLTESNNINEGKLSDSIDDTLKNFKKNFGLDVGFLTTFGAGINGLIRNVSSLIKQYSIQPLNTFEMTNLAIAMIVVYLKKNKSLGDFKNEMLSIAAFTSLIPGYNDMVNSLLGNVDFMDAFMTLIKSIGVYTMLNHFKKK